MTTEAEASAYPLSATRGVALPFDVGNPQGLWITAVAVAASVEKNLPAGWELVVLYATVDTVVMFGDSVTLDLTEDAEKIDAQLVPANTPVAIMLPSLNFKTMSADGSSAGLLYINKYRIWKTAGQQAQQSNL